MSQPRIGIWFIGGRGGVAATATLGLIALQKGLAPNVGLVTELPQFQQLDLASWDNFVVGGHEIRAGTVLDSVERLRSDSRVLDSAVVEACRDELVAVDTRIRPGTLANCGDTIANLAGPDLSKFDFEPVRDTIQRLQNDLREFQRQVEAHCVIVVNIASTEPNPDLQRIPDSWNVLANRIQEADYDALPASSLYAIAAMQLGMPYINFTPSLGAAPPAIQELAEIQKTCHAGQDGKTGETLLKSVLAPMFAARHLDVMSWVGHNIFGNLDGLVLDDPANKAAKIKSKDQLIGNILGYEPQTLVSIEYIRSLGDWKTAWDHIHFRGFLGTPMTMQFIWQGCDSLLAAPLVLDLIRLVELSRRRGEVGVLSHLASFFKRPLGASERGFFQQFSQLLRWADGQQKDTEIRRHGDQQMRE
ncbi:MAG TPA: inositol-3-phosphate synthase [Lacipirellulaceae bacterium]|nr:inositol-3-phosphate synthase [Lacipirellulaceae bacterium]